MTPDKDKERERESVCVSEGAQSHITPVPNSSHRTQARQCPTRICANPPILQRCARWRPLWPWSTASRRAASARRVRHPRINAVTCTHTHTHTHTHACMHWCMLCVSPRVWICCRVCVCVLFRHRVCVLPVCQCVPYICVCVRICACVLSPVNGGARECCVAWV